MRALDLRILLFLVVLTVVAVLSKLIGCGGVALIGLNQGLIKQDIYVTIILMSLVMTIVTPIILRNWLHREGGPAVARRPAR